MSCVQNVHLPLLRLSASLLEAENMLSGARPQGAGRGHGRAAWGTHNGSSA